MYFHKNNFIHTIILFGFNFSEFWCYVNNFDLFAIKPTKDRAADTTSNEQQSKYYNLIIRLHVYYVNCGNHKLVNMLKNGNITELGLLDGSFAFGILTKVLFFHSNPPVGNLTLAHLSLLVS